MARQEPRLGDGVIEEAINLLARDFFTSDQHRIPGPSASGYDKGSNFFGTFKRIDFGMQGEGGRATLDVTYPWPRADLRTLSREEQETLPSKPLDRGVTELLPGNATYRLRIRDEVHWTPITADGASTYLYPSEQARVRAMSDRAGEYSLTRLRECRYWVFRTS